MPAPVRTPWALRRLVLTMPVIGLCMAPGLRCALADTSPAQVVAMAVPPEQIDKALAELDDIAATIMKRSGIPGMAVAVVRDGKTVYAKGFGVRKAGGNEPVGADTVFQLASLSKSLAGTVVAQQVGAGAVQWDTPLVKHLPWFQLKDPWVSTHVTVADMFSHRSGLPDHAGDHLEDFGFDRRAILERLRLLPLSSFRDTYDYTNFGLTAGAEAVAVASGKDWATLSEDALYRPLGMASTSSRFSDFMKQANRATPHVKIDGAYVAKFQREPDAQSPAGGASSSVNDLARWMTLVLQNGTFEGREIIPAAALLPAVRAEVISSHSATADTRPGFYGYGIGVGITSTGRVMLSHSGAFTLGAGTHYRMLPALGLGIAVLTNAMPVGAAEAVGADFFDRVELGRSSRDWFDAYGAVMAGLMTPSGELSGKTPPKDPKPAAALSTYAGTYANDYFGPLDISVKDGRLELTVGPAKVHQTLSHWDGNVFAFSPFGENEASGSRTAVTFKQNGAAPVEEVSIDYLNGEGMGRFVRKQERPDRRRASAAATSPYQNLDGREARPREVLVHGGLGAL
ncbi:serine hydrolase [Aquabacter sp. CN5-332]|uniref:serine hydrolase n=1 Tax=Aquabacter sp. CN5-332 TaxID=3156608 RepID=UPI0032B421D7